MADEGYTQTFLLADFLSGNLYYSDRETYVFICLGLSVVFIVLCVVLVWYLSTQDKLSRTQEIIVRLKDLGVPNFPFTQGEPIFYNGIVSVIGSPCDPDFDIVTMDQPMLRRTVKVLCWRETIQDCLYSNGELVANGKAYKYNKCWVNMNNTDFIDSSSFNDKTYNVNKRAPIGIESQVYTCSECKVGPFIVDVSDVEKALGWKKFTNLFQYEDPAPRIDDDGIWSYDEKQHVIIRQKVPGVNTIGDIVISYEVLDEDFDSKREVMMSACGVAIKNKLQRFEQLSTTVCSGYTGKK